jgi:AraC-like DNA-binding protein
MDAMDYPKAYLYRRIVMAKQFVDSHYSEEINLRDIAGEARFSRFHFIRLFKNIYGKTPNQYLIHVRIEKSKQLLRDATPVTEACFSVGFSSVSSFSGLFKREVGIPPSEFLAQQQNIKSAIQKKPLQFVPGCFSEKNGWFQHRNFEEASG